MIKINSSVDIPESEKFVYLHLNMLQSLALLLCSKNKEDASKVFYSIVLPGSYLQQKNRQISADDSDLETTLTNIFMIASVYLI